MQISEYTTDSIWCDELKIRQPATGYRFAIDAILLAHFIDLHAGDEALEIGSGCGVVTLVLSHLRSFACITAVELQQELAECCRHNFEIRGNHNLHLIQGDVRTLPAKIRGRFDWIFSNPPYRAKGAGRLNPNLQKAIARHELTMKLEDIFICGTTLLKRTGKLALILPDFRHDDFVKLVKSYGFHVRRLQSVYSYSAQARTFFLATVSLQPGERADEPDLVLYEQAGIYTQQTARLLRREF